jgi:hypothetical protein
MLSEAQIERYARHILLREVGGVGQERLLASEVRIDGLSPAGIWAALYLALAGVGRLVLADPRPVPASGLPPLLPVGVAGEARDASMSAALAAYNPDVRVEVARPGAAGEGGAILKPAGASLCLVARASGEASFVGWTDAPPCPRCVPAGDATPEAAALAGSLAASRMLAFLLFGEAERGVVRIEAGREEALSPCPHR